MNRLFSWLVVVTVILAIFGWYKLYTINNNHANQVYSEVYGKELK